MIPATPQARKEHPMNRVAWCALAALLLLLPLRALGRTAPEATPQKVQAALTELERLGGETLKRTGIPGMAMAVVYRDRVVYLKGFGLRRAGRPEAVDADTVFQLASLSK